MHLLRTTPGGFVDDAQGVMRIEQTSAPIVILSSADTTLALLASVFPRLEPGFPEVRLTNQSFLRQPASVDFYVDDVLRHAKVVIRNEGTLDELHAEVKRLWQDAVSRDP